MKCLNCTATLRHEDLERAYCSCGRTLAEFVVPVFVTIHANSAAAAVAAVADALTDEGFEWPEALAVVCSCVGNESEVQS